MKYIVATFSFFILVGLFLYLQVNNSPTPLESSSQNKDIPPHLLRLFPDTDWAKVDPKIEFAVSGGPTKDGIPAIDTPSFIPLSEVSLPDDVQAVVVEHNNTVKVYPYNILIWHEIVNDSIDDLHFAANFCPLCGSAIVYDRTLPDGTITTFGVSGSLLESNMIMYDRATESLWQQSTGGALAGTYYGETLNLVGFQLLDFSTIRANYPTALVMSENTGYVRDYTRNPYAGYEDNNVFVFNPSNLDTRLDPKEIMVVLPIGEEVVTVSWQKLREEKVLSKKVGDFEYTFAVDENSELSITDNTNTELPFYFEMWFSVAVQHGDALVIIE